MAISYTIHTAADLNAGAVSDLLARLPDFTRTAQGVTTSDLQISINEPTPLAMSIIREAFQFRPRLEVDFRLDNLGDRQAALDRILAATAMLLRETPADISLLFNSEGVILTRLRGQLRLNSRPEFWTDARVKLMPEPHEFTAPMIL
jgi:hypothetical protein